MSVRVHAIAKEVNKSSKELIEILTERGYDIKSASASIDNITAQSIIEEFTTDQPEPETEEASTPVAEKVEPVVPAEPAKKAPIVKSKADLDKEKLEKEEAEKAEKAKLVQENRFRLPPPRCPLFHHHHHLPLVLLHHLHLPRLPENQGFHHLHQVQLKYPHLRL